MYGKEAAKTGHLQECSGINRLWVNRCSDEGEFGVTVFFSANLE